MTKDTKTTKDTKKPAAAASTTAPKKEAGTKTAASSAAKKPEAAKPASPAADTKKPETAAAPQNGQAPQMSIMTQYVKDLSFESPGAPMSLRPRQNAPQINVNVNVNANAIAETDYDVILTLTAQGKDGEEVLFNVELVYGGVFRIQNVKQEHLMAFLFVECPRLLFPYARQIISESTRNGGFPPLMIDPIDFARMFQQRLAEEQAKQKVASATVN